MTTANFLASTSRVQLRYIPEVDYGVTPVTGNAINVRMTGETLDFALTKTPDKEIRSDRQVVSTTTTSAAVTGDVQIHMQYGEYDRWLAALMQNPWVTFGTNGVGATFTADITATTITASAAPTGANAFTTLALGQWFKFNNPALTGAAKYQYLRVSTTVAPTATVITLDASTAATTGTAATNLSIASSRLTNGVTMPTFTLERAMNDVSQFMTYRGMALSKFTTTFASAALTVGAFSFMGKDMIRDVTTHLPGTPVASLGFDIQNAVSGVGNIWEAGIPLAGTYIKSLALTIDNVLRAQDAIGTLGSVGLGVGTLAVSGTVVVYFADGNLFDKFLNDTYTSLTLSSKDVAGNGYVFTFPKVMLSKATLQAGAKDTDLMATFNWEAYADTSNATPALRQTMFIDRLGAAVLP